MKSFNLEEAKAGKPVCTRDGKPVRILCFDAKAKYPIKALVSINDIREDFAEYTINGSYYDDDIEDDRDLIMGTAKKDGWMNVHKQTPSFKSDYVGSYIYSTKQEAIANVTNTVIDTIKIEWEE